MGSAQLSTSRRADVRWKVTLSFAPADRPKIKALVAHEAKKRDAWAPLWSTSSALYRVVMRAAEEISTPPAGQPTSTAASSRPAGQRSRSRSRSQRKSAQRGRKVRT